MIAVPAQPEDTPSAWIVVVLGVLVTPTVLLAYEVLHNVFLTFFGLAWLWVVTPGFILHAYPGSRTVVDAAAARGCERATFQALWALPAMVSTHSSSRKPSFLCVTLLVSHRTGARDCGFARAVRGLCTRDLFRRGEHS